MKIFQAFLIFEHSANKIATKTKSSLLENMKRDCDILWHYRKGRIYSTTLSRVHNLIKTDDIVRGYMKHYEMQITIAGSDHTSETTGSTLAVFRGAAVPAKVI